MSKALDYAYKLWPRLRRYALDSRYHIDNNSVERNQRPSVMGCKNYLLSKSDSGTVDNAIIYSLIESCEIVGVNSLQWLTHVLQSLHDDTTAEQITQNASLELQKNSRIELREFFYSKQYGLFRMVTSLPCAYQSDAAP